MCVRVPSASMLGLPIHHDVWAFPNRGPCLGSRGNCRIWNEGFGRWHHHDCEYNADRFILSGTRGRPTRNSSVWCWIWNYNAIAEEQSAQDAEMDWLEQDRCDMFLQSTSFTLSLVLTGAVSLLLLFAASP